MPAKVIPLNKIVELYKVKRWPARKIANHFGVSRQAIYERLRKANVELESELRQKRLNKAKLLKAYNSPLSVPDIAEKLDTTVETLRRELKFHGIPRRKGNPSRKRVPDLSKDLKIDESALIKKVNGKLPNIRFIYTQAQNAGVRITIQKLKDGVFRLTRIA